MIRTKPAKDINIVRLNSSPVRKGKQAGVSTPVKYDPKYIDIIQRALSKGLTQRDIAEILNIDISTLEYWIRTKPEVIAAKERGDKELVENVRKSYIQLALGYEEDDVYPYVNRITEYDEETGKPTISYNKVEFAKITKKFQPNAYACQKILAIKDRVNWTEVNTLEVNNNTQINANINISNNVDLSDFSLEELLTLEKLGMQKQLTNNIDGNRN